MGKLKGAFSSNSVFIELPVAKRTIKLRPYKHGDMKSILNATDSFQDAGEEYKIKDYLLAIGSFIGGLIEEDIMKLHVADVSFIMNKAKEISKSEESKVISTCKKCGNKNTSIFKLSDVVVEDKKTDDKINFDKVIFTMKDFSFQMLVDNSMILEKHSTVDDMSVFYANFIECVEYDNTIYDNLTVDELVNDLIDDMGVEEVDKIKKYIDGQPNLYWEDEYECKECGNKNKVVLNKLLDFFSIS